MTLSWLTPKWVVCVPCLFAGGCDATRDRNSEATVQAADGRPAQPEPKPGKSQPTEPAVLEDQRPTAKSAVPEWPAATSAKDALSTIDFSKWPPMEGASRNSASATSYNFSFDPAQPNQVAQVAEQFRLKLTAEGWKPLDPATLNDVTDRYAQLYFVKQGLISNVSIGLSRGTAGDQLNAGVFLIGNIDLRRLPRVEGETPVNATPSGLSYITKVKLDKVREYYHREMQTRGWVEFRQPDYAEIKIPEENLRHQQNFAQAGVSISLFFREGESGLNISSQVNLLEEQLPLLASVKVAHYSQDPLYYFGESTEDLEAAKSFYRDEFAQLGWTVREGELDLQRGSVTSLEMTAPGKKGLTATFLKFKARFVVEIKHMSDDSHSGNDR